MTRRQFLYNSSATMAAMAVFPASAFGKTANVCRDPLAQISYSQLAALIHTQFRVYAPCGRVVELRLLKAPLRAPYPVAPGRRPPADAGNEKFSLIFSGSRDELLPEAILSFEHDELGRFNMYIGQVGLRDAEEVRYQSVFNRPVVETQVQS